MICHDPKCEARCIHSGLSPASHHRRYQEKQQGVGALASLDDELEAVPGAVTAVTGMELLIGE